MQVIVNGNPITLDKRNVLGSGGEGTVYKVQVAGQSKALKVYEKPTSARSEKLVAFSTSPHRFTDRIIAPEDLAFNKGGLAVGFTMPLIAGDFTEVKFLSNKKYRANFGITTKDVTIVFLDGIPTLRDVIHHQGFVVGDLSDLNILTQNRRMLFWDVDAWQVGRYPCPVATQDFVDPNLYGIDFSLRPVFAPGNDWYSYAVMLFKSLLLVHPYGGTHKTVGGLLERAARKITVFDSNVTYPVVAVSPDILTDDLHDVFDGYFKKGLRNPFPETTLKSYLDTLRECTTCGAYFPSNRGNCPVCSAKMVILIQRPLASGKDIEVLELIRVNGEILYARVIGDEVRVLANERGKIAYYSKRPNLPASYKELFAHVPGAKYEMATNHLFVSRPGTSELLVYSISEAKLLGKLATGVFTPTRRAAFRASNEYLFRIEGNELKYGKMQNGGYEERLLRNVMEDQTWFWVDPNSDTPYVFGLFQVIRQQVFWIIKDGKFFDVSVPQLELGEVNLDISAKFSSQGVLLLRKTQLGGKNYLRQEMIDSTGKVVFSNRLEEGSHPNPTVHGQAYSTGIVLHPTDNGVLQEKVQTGETKLFSSTQGHVDSGDTLIRFGASLLAVKEKRVLQVSVK